MFDWEHLEIGGHRLTCPDCGRGPRDKTMGATIRPDGGMVAHCFRCGFVSSDKGHRRRMAPPPPSKPQAGIKGARACAALWDAAGVEVFITRQQENDLNDLLMEAA